MLRFLAVLVLAGALFPQRTDAIVSLLGYESISEDGSKIRIHGTGFSSVSSLDVGRSGEVRSNTPFVLESNNTFTFDLPKQPKPWPQPGFRVTSPFLEQAFIILRTPSGIILGDNFPFEVISGDRTYPNYISGGSRAFFLNSTATVQNTGGSNIFFVKSGASIESQGAGSLIFFYEPGAVINNSGHTQSSEQVSNISYTRLQLVPEPSSLSLLLAGGAVLMAGRRRNRGRIAPKS